MEKKFKEFVIKTVGKDLAHEESKLGDSGRAMTPVTEEEEYGPELADDSANQLLDEKEEGDKPMSTEMREEIDRLILLPLEQFREQMAMKFKPEAFNAGFELVKAAVDAN